MTHLRFVVDCLRPLIGLPLRSPYWGIDRAPMCDIERARFRRAMRESGKRSALLLGALLTRR